jgi:hypothetical protein
VAVASDGYTGTQEVLWQRTKRLRKTGVVEVRTAHDGTHATLPRWGATVAWGIESSLVIPA